MYTHVPDQLQKKLDDKDEKCNFIGYNTNSKAYKLYNPKTESDHQHICDIWWRKKYETGSSKLKRSQWWYPNNYEEDDGQVGTSPQQKSVCDKTLEEVWSGWSQSE